MRTKIYVLLAVLMMIAACLYAQDATADTFGETAQTYTIIADGKIINSVSLDTLRQMAASGQITASAKVLKDGTSEFVAVATLSELADLLAASAAAEPDSYKEELTASEKKTKRNVNNKNSLPQKYNEERKFGRWMLVSGIILTCVAGPVYGAMIGVGQWMMLDGAAKLDIGEIDSGSRMQIYGIAMGSVFVTAGFVMMPLSSIWYSKAHKIRNIYRKTTGEDFAALMQRTTIGGGYDWENKEVTVAMGIRL